MQGYLIIMKSEDTVTRENMIQHLDELMCRQVLVWHLATSTMLAVTSSLAGPSKRFLNQGKSYNEPARLGTKAGKSFNSGTCFTGVSIPEWQHIWPYCLSTINRAFTHSENSCNRKKLEMETNT